MMNVLKAMMIGMKGKGKGKGKQNPLQKFSAEQKVWVGGLTEDVDWKKLEEHFNSIAKTTLVEIMSKKTACVVYSSAEEATSAIAALNGSVVGTATLECDVWTKSEKQAMTDEKKALIAKVKTFQKSSPESKQTWYSFCDSQPGGKYDPSLYEEVVLQTFLQSVGIAC